MTLGTPTASTPPRIALDGLHKSFPGDGEPLEVLRDISLHVDRGEFVTLLGPSGSGKSTLFSLLTGIEQADAGTIHFDGKPAVRDEHHVAWMPQRDVLLPWRSVEQNVALGAQVAGGESKQAALARARELLGAFGLGEFGAARPSELSGGMRQRAALARTVAQQRDVLLLDEPFGALDALTRTELQLWLEQIWERERWTVLLITHDVREAVLLSDRVYVLGKRPASVKLELAIDLPRPRTLETLADPRVGELETQLLRALEIGAGAG